jgi:dienelactone hydrolase
MQRRQFVTALGALGATMLAVPARAAEPIVAEITVNGLAGRFYAPPIARNRAAVLLLGGSNGGFPDPAVATDLARRGFPVLALAYFRGFTGGALTNLPAQLRDIPLEYLFTGIDWLKARPEVNRRKVVLMGESRGGELVLQLASIRRDVGGVIAFVPSHLRWGAVGGEGAAWTWKGRPLPYARDDYRQGEPMLEGFRRTLDGDPANLAHAAIAVEDIRCPVLLLSTTADKIWPSTRMAEAAMARMAARGKRGPRDHVHYDDASHLMMGPGPGMTAFGSGPYRIEFGGTAEGTRAARDDAWAKALAFMARM